jgi:hypothetical protein
LWSGGTIERETSSGSPRCESIYQHQHQAVSRKRHTLGSASGPFVWTNTTRWANLMQQIRTPGAAVSQIRNILDLIASIRSQVMVSCGLLILFTHACQIPSRYPPSQIQPVSKALQSHLEHRYHRWAQGKIACSRGSGITYIHLKTKGYTLAAVCTTLLTTAASSLGFSIKFLSVSKTIKLIVSF